MAENSECKTLSPSIFSGATYSPFNKKKAITCFYFLLVEVYHGVSFLCTSFDLENDWPWASLKMFFLRSMIFSRPSGNHILGDTTLTRLVWSRTKGFSHIMILLLIHDRSISAWPKSMWFCQGFFSLPVYFEGFSMICRSLLQEPNYPIPRILLRLLQTTSCRLPFPNWLRGLRDFINKNFRDFVPTFGTSLKRRTLWTFFEKSVGLPEIWNFQSHPMSPEWNQPSASMAFTKSSISQQNVEGSHSMPIHEEQA